MRIACFFFHSKTCCELIIIQTRRSVKQLSITKTKQRVSVGQNIRLPYGLSPKKCDLYKANDASRKWAGREKKSNLLSWKVLVQEKRNYPCLEVSFEEKVDNPVTAICIYNSHWAIDIKYIFIYDQARSQSNTICLNTLKKLVGFCLTILAFTDQCFECVLPFCGESWKITFIQPSEKKFKLSINLENKAGGRKRKNRLSF